MLFSSTVRIKLSVWLASTYAHVYTLSVDMAANSFRWERALFPQTVRVLSSFRRCTGCLLNSASTSLQVGRADVEDSADVISAVSEPAHLAAHQCTQHSIVVRPTAVSAISTAIIRQTIVQHCRTSDLELTATCAVLNCDSLYFQIQT